VRSGGRPKAETVQAPPELGDFRLIW